MRYTIFIRKQGNGFTVRFNGTILGFGLNKKEAHLISTGAALALEICGNEVLADYCDEYYKAEF